MNIKRSILLTAIFSLTAYAQEKGQWRAMSTTARNITGDVSISANKVTINFASFTIAQIRTLQPTEVAAVFSDGAASPGNLYALDIPATKVFLHKNNLCGGDEAHWMAVTVSGKTLQIAFFSEPRMPVFTSEAIINDSGLCGTFSYSR